MRIPQSVIIVLVFTLLVSACAAPAATTAATAIPTVRADSAIISEGRLEPVRYAEGRSTLAAW